MSTLATSRSPFVKLARYIATGGLAAVVDGSGFAIFTRCGLPVLLAATLSFCTAAVVNYLLSSRLVFERQASTTGFGRFLIAALVGLSVNVGVTMVCASTLHTPLIAAKILGIGAAFLINFTLNLLFVFK